MRALTTGLALTTLLALVPAHAREGDDGCRLYGPHSFSCARDLSNRSDPEAIAARERAARYDGERRAWNRRLEHR